MAGVAMTAAARVVDTAATRHEEDEPLTIDAHDVLPARRGATVGSTAAPDDRGVRVVEVVVDGWRFEFEVEDAARADLRDRATRDRQAHGGAGEPLEIRAIIPGRIASVAVVAGDEVEVGQTLLAVEAMKMQNELRAPRSGVVSRVAVTAGATVELGDVLVVLA